MNTTHTAGQVALAVQHIDHLNLSVRDLAETRAWYARVLDFQQVEAGLTEEGVPWAILRSGEAMLCLYEHPQRELLDGAQLRERSLYGLNHFALRIANAEALVARLEAEGVPLHFGSPVRWPHSTAYYVCDPTGYEIELVLWEENTVAF